MATSNVFIKKAFSSNKKIPTGFIPDPPDKRDYKFSELMKSQGNMKTVDKKVKKAVSKTRGIYRKEGYGSEVEEVIIKEEVPTKDFITSAPLKVDYTPNLSTVKDQGNRPTCVGFAAAAMKEYQEKLEHLEEIKEGKKGDPNKVYDYSEEWIYDNCKKIDGSNGRWEGTYIRAAMKVLKKIGVPTENAWPYQKKSGVDIGKPASWSEMIARWAVIGSYWRVDTLEEIKAALIDGPVIIGGPVFIEWASPVNGIIKYPSNPKQNYGGHAVVAVGYDDNRKLLKFKNSWSKFWGDRGYGYMSYRNIRDFRWSGWTARDITVTKGMLKGEGDRLTPLKW